MDNERTIIIKEKSEGGALKLAAIVALVVTSPFWMVMGIVVIGGLMFALALTLFVIPAVYSYLSREKKVHLTAVQRGEVEGPEFEEASGMIPKEI